MAVDISKVVESGVLSLGSEFLPLPQIREVFHHLPTRCTSEWFICKGRDI